MDYVMTLVVLLLLAGLPLAIASHKAKSKHSTPEVFLAKKMIKFEEEHGQHGSRWSNRSGWIGSRQVMMVCFQDYFLIAEPEWSALNSEEKNWLINKHGGRLW